MNTDLQAISQNIVNIATGGAEEIRDVILAVFITAITGFLKSPKSKRKADVRDALIGQPENHVSGSASEPL